MEPSVNIALFELCCVAIVAGTLAAMARRRGWGPLLGQYAPLAVAAWLGEASCVGWYEYYSYSPAWHLRLLAVPVLVPLIWPLVVLSARDVVTAVAPFGGARRHLLVGLVVAFDASLVEVVAVRAGLWGWAEGGHLGVPLVGMLGWGFFAAGASWVLDRHGRWRLPALVLLGPAFAHAGILAAWWGVFRWILRGDLGPGSLGIFVALGLALAGASAVARRRGRGLDLDVAAPRMIAALLFVGLLVATAPRAGLLWGHAAAVALPYLVVTRWRRPSAEQAEVDVVG